MQLNSKQMQNELARAAANGINEYLSTVRGRQFFGSTAKVLPVEEGSTVFIEGANGNYAYDFEVEAICRSLEQEA